MNFVGQVRLRQVDNAQWHGRDYILGGRLVGPDKTGILFICPKCVEARTLQRWVQRDKRIDWLEWLLETPAARLRWR